MSALLLQGQLAEASSARHAGRLTLSGSVARVDSGADFAHEVLSAMCIWFGVGCEEESPVIVQQPAAHLLGRGRWVEREVEGGAIPW